MECNKEEAVRARDLAERKMQSSDFLGAHKIALKAQQLFPDLDNISQLLTVCEIHCSAQLKANGTDMNWYGILQIENKADDATIKKQYRKLALLLHPDKNKFAGAEAAFKMIGEANRVLSDREKRSVYDSKCRVSARTTTAAPRAPPHQVQKNSNSFVRKQQYTPPNNFQKVPNNSQFTGLNPHQQSSPGVHNVHATFWTCCPYCNMRYQYYRNIVNKNLRCQNCSKPYVAHDMGPQGVPLIPNLKPTHQKGIPTPGVSKVGPQSTSGNPPFTSGFQASFASTTDPVTKAGIYTRVAGESKKTKGKEEKHVDVGSRKEAAGKSKYDAAMARESAAINTSKKKRRNSVEESDEESVSSDDTDEELGNEENCFSTAAESTGGDRRRSSRQKQHVSYNEQISDDDDFVSPPKRPSEHGTSSAINNDIKVFPPDGGASGSFTAVDEKEIKQKSSSLHEKILPNRKRKIEDDEDDGPEVVTTNQNEENPDVEDNSESDPEIYEYPDPDFSDFDKDKDEHCFSADQVWAAYDTIDSMPRFYARVKKVYSPVFKLQIVWLEFNPNDQAEFEWARKGLPVACGKFKQGSCQEISDRIMFSHKVDVIKGSGKGCVIYPRKGQIWALFKDWNIGWSSDPESHKAYKFEIVEILSDFNKANGAEVAYLSKVRGFVSLFQKKTHSGTSLVQIPAKELFKFSHQIPSFKMTGMEREGVPKDSCELDPVSLPRDLDEFYDPNDLKKDENMDIENNGWCSKSSENIVKLKVDSEMTKTPLKCDKIELESENLTPGRSSSYSNSINKKPVQVNSDQCQEEANIFPEANSYDFSERKTEEKFKLNQVWALYNNSNFLPNKYAQVRGVLSSPFGLRVTFLEPISPPENTGRSVSCGTFKFQNFEFQVVKHESFSHLVTSNYSNDSFKIYPKKDEVWAVYKNCNTESSWCSGPNQEYEIVEVLNDNEVCIKVSPLVCVSKVLYRSRSKQRLRLGVTEIPLIEAPLRFSHQIPAFWHTGEKDARLQNCWELDPSSVPGTTDTIILD